MEEETKIKLKRAIKYYLIFCIIAFLIYCGYVFYETDKNYKEENKQTLSCSIPILKSNYSQDITKLNEVIKYEK